MRLAIAAIAALSLSSVQAMDALPVQSKLPPVSKIGAVPSFVGPLSLQPLVMRWRLLVGVTLGGEPTELYAYLHAHFDTEAACAAFLGEDRDFKDALAILIARAQAAYGSGAAIGAICAPIQDA